MAKKKSISLEEVQEYYLRQNLNVYDTAEKMGISGSTLARYLKKNNITKTKEQVLECKKKKYLAHYKVEHPSQSPEIKEQKKQTCLKNYGTEFPAQSPIVRDKMQSSCFEKRGVLNPMQSEEVKEKLRITCQKKYGYDNPLKCPEIQEKVKHSLSESYGVEFPFQSKEILKKARATCLERYGYENPLQSPEWHEKIHQIFVEKHGVTNPVYMPDHFQKAKQTLFEHFGVDNALKIPHVEAALREGARKKYGVDNPVYSPEWQREMKERFFSENGCYNIAQTKWPEGTFDVLSSEDKLKEYISQSNDKTRIGLAASLGCSESTIGVYIRLYHLEEQVEQIASHPERELKDFLDGLGVKNYKSKSIISPFEIDCYCPEYGVGIEFNGSHWHNQEKKGRWYHLWKTLKAQKQGVFLIHIFEHEWKDKERQKEIKNFLQLLFSPNGEEKIINLLKESERIFLITSRAIIKDSWCQKAGYSLASRIFPKAHTTNKEVVYDCGWSLWIKNIKFLEEGGEL